MTTTKLQLPELSSGAADSIVMVNEILLRLESAISVKSRALSSPPGSPALGDAYLVKATGSGSWVGKSNQIAIWNGSAWKFINPAPGIIVWVENEKVVASSVTGPSWFSRAGEAYFGATKTTSNDQSVAGTTPVDVQWNQQQNSLTNSQVFAHSTSTDPHLISIKETGEYEVSTNLTFEATSTAAWTRMDCWLATSPTSTPSSVTDVPSGKSCGPVRPTDVPRNTVAIHGVFSLNSGDDLRVRVARSSATASTINLIEDSRFRIRRI